ncbi:MULTISPECIES: YggT family protein [unclassified Pseudomonas]|jgi:YggT family protein|uniref:YggT family protein n=1 Tax=unclassified Pseudomonas TaxID=196821 RepID=UPI000F578A66|nr:MULTISPECIES: YggT family protein [unclassified Pseudomonas]AZF13182.1 Cell division integral membrane protein, YggT [Pseudomonas sp. R2-37-08W]AZF18439.1 Cell division integral membrane protein, YggT [Pseudomonas sp. R3-18-08]AZF23861.1 Cell division integral membrane protein, YggT [Pseudomonas sp. R3-52-08]AZF29165.1 Cell division integral membrane protein, YggT [Pseudomonas sp. R2-60-08W]AZF34477.1 Cell division integral membrane protein, YggT [Pseudomonas sp. R4-35-07]
MLGINDAAIFIIQTLGSLYLLIVLMRFILQLVRANFYNPLCQFVVKATQPLLKPLRRVIPSLFGLDMSSLVLALLLQILLFVVILMLNGYQAFTVLLLPWALIGIFSLFLKIIFWSMIISVILSWVAPGSRSPGAELVYQITEPVLAPFRRLIPNLGGLDISPIFAFIAIQLIQSWVIPRLAFYAFMPKELFGLI